MPVDGAYAPLSPITPSAWPRAASRTIQSGYRCGCWRRPYARYQDSPAGTVTLHSTASLEALRESLGDPELDGLRFRSNIVIDGVEAWEEFT